MWIRNVDKYNAKESIIKNADKLLDLPDDIAVDYDFPGLKIPQDVHVIVKLLNNTMAVSHDMKKILADMINAAEAFIIKEGTSESGAPCIDLVFSVYEVETYDPNEVPSEEVLKEVGLL